MSIHKNKLRSKEKMNVLPKSEKKQPTFSYEGEVRGIKTTIKRYADISFTAPPTLEVRSALFYVNLEEGLDKRTTYGSNEINGI